MPSNLLFEINAIDPVSGAIHVIRMSSAHAEETGVFLNNLTWLPLIVAGPQFDYDLWDQGQPKPLTVAYGQISFITNATFANLDWPSYSFDGALATVWHGQDGDPFSSYRQIWTGALGPLVRDSSQVSHLVLLGSEASLARDLLYSTYGGIGGLEGDAGLLGNLKPFTIGQCTSIEPTLINANSIIYQVHGYGFCQINAVFELGVSLGPSKADYSTYNDLANATLNDGEWATCYASGLFRLADNASGKLTADVGAHASVGTVVSTLLTTAGIPASKIDSSVAAATGNWCLSTTQQVSILDTIHDAAFAGGTYLTTDGTGKFYLASYASSKTPSPLADDGTLPIVFSDKIVQENVVLPTHRLKIGHTRVWSVSDIADISPALADLGQDMTAAQAAADAAQQTADQAKAQAAQAIARLTSIAADNVLDRSDKKQLSQIVQTIVAEKPRNVAAAQAQGVDYSAYVSAFNSLISYLNGLSPAYDDTTQDTSINSTTFDNAFIAYYTADTDLDIAVAAAAAKSAVWVGITGTGKPTDYADVTANNTSADTAKVNGVPAATITTNLASQGAIVFDTTPPDVPGGLALSSSISTDANGNSIVTLKATWNASAASDTAGYVLSLATNGGGFIDNDVGAVTSYNVTLPAATAVQAKIAAYDRNSNKSGYSAVVSTTTARDTVAPGLATNITASTLGLSGVTISWTNPADSDLASANVFEASSNNVGAAVQVASVNAKASGTSSATLTRTTGATNYYWVQTVDTSGNKSALAGGVAGTVASVSNANLTPGLSGIQTVTSLPASGNNGPTVVFYNNKLYRWVYANQVWSSNVDGNDVVAATIPNSAFASSNLSSLVNTDSIKNTLIGLDGNGALQGIGSGSGTPVANTAISLTGGALTGIGAGSGTAVANNLVSINAAGQLTGAGGGQVTIGGLGYTGALNATADIGFFYTGDEPGTNVVFSGNAITKVAGGTTYSDSNGNHGVVAIPNASITGPSRVTYGGIYAQQKTVVGFLQGQNRYVSSITFGIETDNGYFYAFVNGSRAESLGIFDANTVFELVYDNTAVVWKAGGSILKKVTVAAGYTFIPHFHVLTVGTTIGKIGYTPYTDNAWSSVAGAGRPADNATVGDNLIVNPNLDNNAAGWNTNANVVLVNGGSNDPVSRYFVATANNAGVGTSGFNNRIPAGTKRLFVTYYINRSDYQQVTNDFSFLDASGNYVGFLRINDFGNTPVGVWQQVRYTFDGVPDRAVQFAFGNVTTASGATKFGGYHIGISQMNADVTALDPKVQSSDFGAAAGDNLVVNGDFTDGLNNYWTPGAAISVLAGSSANDPAFFARTLGGGGNGSLYVRKDHNLPIQAGRTVYFSGRLRSTVAGNQFVVSAYAVTSQGNYGGYFLNANAYINAANVWQDFEFVGVVPSTAASAVVTFSNADPGSGQNCDFAGLRIAYTQRGATVGAQAGVNLKDSTGSPLGDAQVKNSAITIGSNGALSGAGGGSVTITGLGYTGDLNATKGATIGGPGLTGNITDASGAALNIGSLATNLVDLTNFTPGSTAGAWNGFGGVNSVILRAGISGASEVTLKAQCNGAAAGEGGFMVAISQARGFDPSKTYRYSFWIQTDYVNPASGYFYFGSAYPGPNGNQVKDTGQLGGPGNPYWGSYALPTSNKWYLVVAVIHGASFTGSDSGTTGVYDPVTGQKVYSGVDQTFLSTATDGGFRAFQYYGENGKSTYFTRIRCEEVTSATPTIAQLMATVGAPAGTMVGGTVAEKVEARANDPAAWINTGNTTTISGGRITTGSITAGQIQTGAITIGANGQLGGAGTGQVTIGGLGYSGDLNATRGAPAGTVIGSTDASVVEARARYGSQYIDTRNDNQPPSYYYALYATTGTVREFKSGSAIGLTGSASGYVGCVTTIPWQDPSGGPVKQTVTDGAGLIWTRYGNSSSWSAWADAGAQVNAGVTTINGGKITTNSLDANRIMAGTVLANNITISGSNTTLGTVNSVIQDPAYYINSNATTINGGKITTGSLTALQIQGGSITGDRIAGATITGNLIAANTIVGNNIAGSTITGNLIAGRTIQALNLQSGTITANEIAGGTITGDKIAGSTITGNNIVGGTIQAAQIAAGAITASKIGVIADSLNPDPAFADATMWHNIGSNSGDLGPLSGKGWYLDTGSYVAGELGCATGLTLWTGSSSWTDQSQRMHCYPYVQNLIPIVGGKTYEISATMFNNMNQWANIQFDFFNGDGSYANYSQSAGAGANSGRQTISAVATPPAGAAYARPVIYNQGTGNGYGGPTPSGYIRVSNVQLREQLGGTMVVDGSITAGKIAAGTITADKISGGTITGDKISSSTSLPGSIQVDYRGWTLGNMVDGSYDPANRINNGPGTQITPGKINIAGGTTLANWRNGGDNTKIEGGAIAANTILANSATFGARNLYFYGFNFRCENGNLVWDYGEVRYINDAGNGTDGYGVNGGSRAYSGGHMFIWTNRGNATLYVDNNNNPGNPNDFQMGSWEGGTNINVTYGRTIINGDYIQTGTVRGDRIIANTLNGNTIIGNTINAGCITAGTITTDRLVDNSITKSFVLVSGQSFSGNQSSGTGYQAPSGGTGGSGGGGTYCPEIATPILLANDERTGPGEWITAGELVEDAFVWTRHEHTMAWGAYRVTQAMRFTGMLWEAPGYHRATKGHRFRIGEEWVRIDAIGVEHGEGDAMAITIEHAHTYVTKDKAGYEVLNHNAKQVGQEQ